MFLFKKGRRKKKKTTVTFFYQKGIHKPMISLSNSLKGKFTHTKVHIYPNIYTAISIEDNTGDKKHSLNWGRLVAVLKVGCSLLQFSYQKQIKTDFNSEDDQSCFPKEKRVVSWFYLMLLWNILWTVLPGLYFSIFKPLNLVLSLPYLKQIQALHIKVPLVCAAHTAAGIQGPLEAFVSFLGLSCRCPELMCIRHYCLHELSDRSWNKCILCVINTKVGRVIHAYHWFTCILQPKATPWLCSQRLILQVWLSYQLQSDTSLHHQPCGLGSPCLVRPLNPSNIQALSAWPPWHRCSLFSILILRCWTYCLSIIS